MVLDVFKLSAAVKKQKRKLPFWEHKGMTQTCTSLARVLLWPDLDWEFNALINIAAARQEQNAEEHSFRGCFCSEQSLT